MKKTFVSISFLILALAMLVGCTNSESAIVGTWVSDDDDVGEITFFNDGKFSSTATPRSGTYSISNDQLMVSESYGDSWTFEYKISGNTLTLTLQGQGESITLKKQK